ncbi:hypothetical protein ACIBL6_10135 [Streptomyces sp. NPDC050400]|uniref:hypothetical protein n=1 Tax=Streptomyces sp. NPDC050400 TaxID=3365610 RepID=UPI00379F0A28
MPAVRNPALRHVLTMMLTPILMCVGMGLAYLGAFSSPEPHHMPVAVVGSGPQAKVFAQTVKDRAGDKLDVRTLDDRSTAIDRLMTRDIDGAYVLGGKAPELIVAGAGSDTTVSVVEKVFTPVAARQGLPLTVTDVAPTVDDDPTGQGLFFLLVAVSIGSYASVAVIGGAGAVLRMRTRALLVVAASGVVSLIGAAFAGPVFHLAHQHLWGLWAMTWLYSAGILFIGVGLHTFLKKWTTLGVMVLFVMLNFTSSGGIFRPDVQNGFFAALHGFWNGAGYVEGARSLLYFDSYDLARNVWTLVAWLAAGLVVIGVAKLAESRQERALTAPAAPARSEAELTAEADEEAEQAVGV